MASQILSPFDVTGAASAATRQGSTLAGAGSAGPRLGDRPAFGHQLAWLVLSVATGLAAASAAAGWMIESIHLF